MIKSPLTEMRRQLKTLLVSYLLCGVALLVIISLLHFTTSYYATTYPYSNITQLQHNFTTIALSMFNGYTEKVPSSANQTYIMQNIAGIRQAASTSASTTIEELALAFMLLMFFSVFSFLLSRNERRGRKPWLLPVIFLISLMLSQYVVFLNSFLRGGAVSGISLFFVDSLAVIIWFGIINEWLIIRAARGASNMPYLNGPSAKPLMVLLAVLLPVIVAILTLTLLANLGLLAHNSSFIGTYLAHSAGLLEFVFLFAFLFYYPQLLALIRRARGYRRPIPQKSRTRQSS